MAQPKTPLTQEQRVLRARMGAYGLHAKRDPRETTKAARDKFQERFEREIADSDPGLRRRNPAEFNRRVTAARRRYFVGLALASSKARRRRADRKAS